MLLIYKEGGMRGMQPPDNERNVLTWARDINGNESWQIDSYSINKATGIGFWVEATVWDMKVLFWKELDPKPDCKERE